MGARLGNVSIPRRSRNWRKLKTQAQVQTQVQALWKKYHPTRGLRVTVRGSERRGTLHLDVTRRERARQRQAQQDGQFMILTDRGDLKPKPVLHAYRCHDANESAFQIIKGSIKLRPVFHYSEARVRRHVFICFLAFFLRSRLAYLLHRAQISFTPERALRYVRNVRLNERVVKEQKLVVLCLTEATELSLQR